MDTIIFLPIPEGSICEVVDPDDPDDPVLSAVSRVLLPVQIRGTREQADALVARFEKAPKPMYYPEDFLRTCWAEYLSQTGLTEDRVDPDAFIAWGFRRLIDHRLPRYDRIAAKWGVTVEAAEIEAVETPADFDDLIARAIARR